MIPRTRPPRAVVEDVWPRVDGGRTAIRRCPGDPVEVFADVYADGTAGLRAELRWRPQGRRTWDRVPMAPVGNDRWHATFVVPTAGRYEYEVAGWVDPFRTWRALLERRAEAGRVDPRDVREGAEILRAEAARVGGSAVRTAAEALARTADGPIEGTLRIALDPALDAQLATPPEPSAVERSVPTLAIDVDPPIAQHSAWYELFPRSTSLRPGRHATWAEVRARLAYVAELGFDVVYFPPIHPIGAAHRRGPDNTVPAPPGSPGSPWAIGSIDGGHTAVHPELGDLAGFRETVDAARRLGLEVALDLAFQCSPDHPWVREHPDWFSHRPDGTIRPAENPPKRYDDIYPLDFATDDWAALWQALLEVVEFWVAQGIRWFRVDNPHTKPFAFWAWLIGTVRRAHPETMFLAEAFTRPKVMYRLAKVGFTHSYTYFAWRTGRAELEAYFRELASGPVGEFFRPHLWPNTPDILTEQFQTGQRSVFVQRLVLAATLSAHYGLYGPAYELLEHAPLVPGKEEYRASEKYELRSWALDRPGTLAPEIRRLNRIRRAHPALTRGRRLAFHGVDNDCLLAFSRRTEDRSDVVLVVVNLDPAAIQAGWTSLDLGELGLPPDVPFQVEDLLADVRYSWRGPRNYVRLDPAVAPAHVFHVGASPGPLAGGRGEA